MRPTSRVLPWVMALLVLAAIVPFQPLLLQPWLMASILLLILLMLDLALVLRQPDPKLQRHLSHTLPLGVWSEVRLILSNQSARSCSFRIHDMYPTHVNVKRMPLDLVLPPSSSGELSYRLQPIKRGAFSFQPAQVLVRSPLGLWWRIIWAGEHSDIRVYPNFQAVAGYTLLAASHRLTQIGIHKRQRRGEGREFHQLREYVQGDPLRQVDWKASSRMRKLITREFQDARDQQIVFLLDCGSGMRSQDKDLSHFDHALNAVLLMTNVALRHGDAVGLMTFSGPRRWLAARKGTAQMNLILNTIYDIQPGLETSDFMGVASQVQSHLRKRSLIILVTNLRDEDDEELAPALRLMRRRHLVLVASMRERVLEETLEKPGQDFKEMLTHAATQLYLAQREGVAQRLKTRGIYLVDTIPEKLPISMINHYLDIKGKGVL